MDRPALVLTVTAWLSALELLAATVVIIVSIATYRIVRRAGQWYHLNVQRSRADGKFS